MWITGCENGVYVEVDTIKGTHTGCPKGPIKEMRKGIIRQMYK